MASLTEGPMWVVEEHIKFLSKSEKNICRLKFEKKNNLCRNNSIYKYRE